MPNLLINNKINEILTSIKCEEILEFLSHPNFDKIGLLTLTIESKVGYEKVILDNECANIIDEIEERKIYLEPNYSNLINYISNLGIQRESDENLILLISLRNFHALLLKTLPLVIKLISNNWYESVAVTNNIITNPLSQSFKIGGNTMRGSSSEIFKPMATVHNDFIFESKDQIKSENANQFFDQNESLQSFLQSIKAS